jgi:AraC-like DNA-binding protein
MQRLNGADEPDPLGDVLAEVRFRSTIFCRSDMTAPWGFSVTGREIATFHFVDRGTCWLEAHGAGVKVPLTQGDFVILPHGHAHVVRDTLTSEVTRLDDLVTRHHDASSGTLRFGGGGAATTLVCGGFTFDDREALPFLSALPPILHIREPGGRIGGWLRIAQEIMASESEAGRIGESTILNRISDLIFIEAVKSHFTDAAGGARGWFAALTDRHVGKAISLIHRELDRPWTVKSLASAVGMSRTAFALRFSLLLGESPIRYLASRRIARARALLEHGGLTVSKTAGSVGYDSEVAFSKAFKRHVGLSPVDYRRAKSACSDQRELEQS